MTLELRHDRVYQTFIQLFYNNINNLTIFDGNAINIITKQFSLNTISHIFINHPEPPQQTQATNNHLQLYESQAKHLLTNSFLLLLSNILIKEGLITIMTDNLWYAKYLLKEFSLSSFTNELSSIDLLSDNNLTNKQSNNSNNYQKLDEAHGIHLYSGLPDETCGHVIQASSYFDR